MIRDVDAWRSRSHVAGLGVKPGEARLFHPVCQKAEQSIAFFGVHLNNPAREMLVHIQRFSLHGRVDLETSPSPIFSNQTNLELTNFRKTGTFEERFYRIVSENRVMDSIEMCAGAGGQALGIEQAGFFHAALVEIDAHCCATLRHNRPAWNVIEEDLRIFKDRATEFKGVDLVAGGLPCPPFSVAGKQLGEKDERNLFPDALDIVDAIRPKAVLIENVRGFLDPAFSDYRDALKTKFEKLGYVVDWRLLNASDYGVSQLRPRVAIVALRKAFADKFVWPEPSGLKPPTVGELLYEQMAENGWEGADAWKEMANSIAPTIVGGSKKHGGPDLGPTRARRAWEALSVNGKTISEHAPEPDFSGMPRLTVQMVARIQGFPDEWSFLGKKTHAYRQVGNAFPPPVARAVADKIAIAVGAKAFKAAA